MPLNIMWDSNGNFTGDKTSFSPRHESPIVESGDGSLMASIEGGQRKPGYVMRTKDPGWLDEVTYCTKTLVIVSTIERR